jgi:hypothetical protein
LYLKKSEGARSVLCDVAISLSHSFILRRVAFFTGHDEHLIYSISTIPHIIKDDSRDCHDLKKPGLAMTTQSSFSLDGRR